MEILLKSSSGSWRAEDERQASRRPRGAPSAHLADALGLLRRLGTSRRLGDGLGPGRSLDLVRSFRVARSGVALGFWRDGAGPVLVC